MVVEEIFLGLNSTILLIHMGTAVIADAGVVMAVGTVTDLPFLLARPCNTVVCMRIKHRSIHFQILVGNNVGHLEIPTCATPGYKKSTKTAPAQNHE